MKNELIAKMSRGTGIWQKNGDLLWGNPIPPELCCPNCGSSTLYDLDLDLNKCNKCKWKGQLSD